MKTELAYYLPVFLTCRKVYHEAASTLYTNNSFVITRTDIEKCWYGHTRVEQAIVAGIWMQQLRSQIFMLPRITIGLDKICTPSCDTTLLRFDEWDFDLRTAMDIFPLIKILWTNPDLKIDVSIVHPKGEAHCRYHHSRYQETDIRVDALMAVLEAFRRDRLDVKKYWRSIDEILVHRDGSGGSVIYKSAIRYKKTRAVKRNYTAYAAGNGVALSFELADKGQLLTPYPIQKVIYDMVLYGPHRENWVCFDLDQKVCHGADPRLLGVCSTHRHLSYSFWTENWVKVKMTTQQTSTNFANFEALEKWWCVQRSNREGRRGTVARGELKLELQFDVAEGLTLRQLRVGIIDLLRVTAHLDSHTRGYCRVHLTFSLTKAGQEGEASSEHDVVWRIPHPSPRSPDSIQAKAPRPSERTMSSGLDEWARRGGRCACARAECVRGIMMQYSPYSKNEYRIRKEYIVGGLEGRTELEEEEEEDDDDNHNDKVRDWSLHHDYWDDPVPVSRYYDGTLSLYIAYLRRVVGASACSDYWAKKCK